MKKLALYSVSDRLTSGDIEVLVLAHNKQEAIEIATDYLFKPISGREPVLTMTDWTEWHPSNDDHELEIIRYALDQNPKPIRYSLSRHT